MFDMKRGSLKKGSIFLILTVVVTALIFPTFIFAQNGFAQESLSILESGKILNGPGFFAGSNVRIDGDVDGVAFVTGQQVVINGTINGDLFIAGQSISINGRVTGNIYSAGQTLVLGGNTVGDAFLAGQNLIISDDSIFERDLFAVAASMVQSGTVQRDFNGGGGDLSISGTTGRNVNLDGDRIRIEQSAVIGGDLLYKSESDAFIAPTASIAGQTHWEYIDRTPEEKVVKPAISITMELLGMASALLLWFLFILLKPDIWNKTSDIIAGQTLKTMGAGALALIVIPILAILFMITLIGIPAGILLGIAFAVTIYLSKIIVSACIGSWLAKRFGLPIMHKGVWLFLLGLVFLTGLGMVPILNILVWLGTVFAGLGAIVTLCIRKKDNSAAAVDPVKASEQ